MGNPRNAQGRSRTVECSGLADQTRARPSRSPSAASCYEHAVADAREARKAVGTALDRLDLVDHPFGVPSRSRAHRNRRAAPPLTDEPRQRRAVKEGIAVSSTARVGTQSGARADVIGSAGPTSSSNRFECQGEPLPGPPRLVGRRLAQAPIASPVAGMNPVAAQSRTSTPVHRESARASGPRRLAHSEALGHWLSTRAHLPLRGNAG